MKMKEVKNVLSANGISYEERQIMKGSCMVDALSVGEGSIRPSIYERSVEDIETEDELLSFIERITGYSPSVNINNITDLEFIKDHCISCIRHETNDESIIKWPVYGDLEEYIRIDLGSDDRNNNMSCILTHAILDQIGGIEAEELRLYARNNLRSHASIKSMREMLLGLSGIDIGEDTEPVMYVATTDTTHGAAVILLQDMLQNFCEEHNISSIVIIPCSLHEVLLMSQCDNLEMINSLICDVNKSDVDEWEQLSDHYYLYESVVA